MLLRLWCNGPNRRVVDDPSVSEVDGFFGSIDGVSTDEGGLLLAAPGGPVGMIVVGGGREDRVIVSWQWAIDADVWDNNLVMLVDRSQPNATFPNVEGGQLAEHPARWSVPKSMALRALRRFAEKHELDPELEWDLEPAPPGVSRELSSAEVVAISDEIAGRLARP